jgi:DNA helicase-2/ATP-dependent DNA helicase PcrA
MTTAGADSNRTLDDHVDEEIAACLSLKNPNSFFLFAGAGSGKTRSLVTALRYVRDELGDKLRLRGQRIGVITYTNAACDEIISRIDFDALFHVSTIHSFAWQLIGSFHADIRAWLKLNLREEIAELQELEAKGRPGTKASITRLSSIESKAERLARLDTIRTFVYNPNGDNRETNSLNHSEVISLAASFLASKPLMQSILIYQYPFLFIDESQDTNKHLVDAFFAVEAKHRSRFCLGFFGDTMQRIYNDGKERIEVGLPAEWKTPIKQLNFRCPKRVVRLINRIRKDVDDKQQEPVSDAAEGCVRLFLLPSTTANKTDAEKAVGSEMAKITGDEDWNDRDRCKVLTLEHHMAAKRMGFQELFDTLYAVDDFRTGLLEGSLPAIRLFANPVLKLVTAHRAGDKFAVAKVIREASPLLAEAVLAESKEPKAQLRAAKEAVDKLMSAWERGDPTCGDVLESIATTGLFDVPDSLKPLLELRKNKNLGKADASNQADQLPDRTTALEEFLRVSFSQVEQYARYISDDAPFGTHQGVKGLEFDRVMVLMDPAEERGFMFDYEKLFGAKAVSAADIKNEREGKETSLDRTRRLFYVTCSRAMKSLAIVAYSESPQLVQRTMIANEWFQPDEIIMM